VMEAVKEYPRAADWTTVGRAPARLLPATPYATQVEVLPSRTWRPR